MKTIQNSTPQLLARLNSPLRGYRGEALPGTDWVALSLAPGQSAEQALASLRQDSRVAAVVPNSVYHLDSQAAGPDDLDPRQWSLPVIHAPQAWSQTTGSGPVVAVLDTGLDTRHPDLVGNLWTNPGEIAGNGKDDDGNGYVDDVHGIDALHQTGDLHDVGEHGTHVAGIIGAQGNNGQGICGVSQAHLMGLKIFDESGNTDVATIIRAIHYATTMGATILSCSWGGAPYNQALYESMRDCGALLVCSAGNDGSDNDAKPHYPSSFDLPNLLSVAASNREDGLSFTSCYGAQSVDLMAPGIQILSTVPGGGYKVKSGTSQATPHVSGVAALVASLHPQDSPEQIKARLLSSVEALPELQGKVVSGGRLDAARAVDARGLHGPHLLRDFYADFQAGREEAAHQDNQGMDSDFRPDHIELGPQQTLLSPDGMALREKDSNGDTNMLVWLEGRREGDHIVMDQKGFARDREGVYSFPLHLDGGPQTPFDPPDAERITLEQFERAEASFEEAWERGPVNRMPGCYPDALTSLSAASMN